MLLCGFIELVLVIEIDCGSVKSIDSGATQTEILSDDPLLHCPSSPEEVVKPGSNYSTYGKDVEVNMEESACGTLSLAQLTSLVNDHTHKISQGSAIHLSFYQAAYFRKKNRKFQVKKFLLLPKSQ